MSAKSRPADRKWRGLKERRYRCTTCNKTFSETSGTALYGIKKPPQDFVRVVTLLGHGCPVQAIVASARWRIGSGARANTVKAYLNISSLV